MDKIETLRKLRSQAVNLIDSHGGTMDNSLESELYTYIESIDAQLETLKGTMTE